jgi:hypothetical protein
MQFHDQKSLQWMVTTRYDNNDNSETNTFSILGELKFRPVLLSCENILSRITSTGLVDGDQECKLKYFRECNRVEHGLTSWLVWWLVRNTYQLSFNHRE